MIKRGMQKSRPKVKLTAKAPKNAKMTGEVLSDGRPVYRRKRPIYERRPKRDLDGNVLYHAGPDGRATTRHAWELVKVGEDEYEFVSEDLGNGMSYANRHFRLPKEEVERRRLQRIREEAVTELGEVAGELKAEGLDLKELLALLKERRDLTKPRRGGGFNSPEVRAKAQAAKRAKKGDEAPATA
jgi:hypothetical protein